jgi:hypothetical protein
MHHHIYFHNIVWVKQQVLSPVLWLTSVIPNTWEAKIGRIMVQGQCGQTVHETPPSPKQSGWTGGMGQTVDCQLCKNEALSSNPTTTKINK